MNARAGDREPRPLRWMAGMVVVLVVGLQTARSATAGDIERAPIHYSESTPDNVVSRLDGRLQAGELELEYDEELGYLRSLLRALDVPESSQGLVFSKTSLQRTRINSRAPRAIYFNDDVYVGFCRRGEVLEVTAVDPQLGAVFYTLDQEPDEPPRLERQTNSCTICHASSHSEGVPGHIVRSVFASASGEMILSAGTHRTDQNSPLHQRWAGWYVTGTHGAHTHMGNFIARDERLRPEKVDNSAGLNVTDLSDRFDTSRYLSGHSDIVALMVLEHQTGMHNLITRANYLTRQALWYEASLAEALGEPSSGHRESTLRRIEYAGEPLVKYLLFSGEAGLTDPIAGTSGFAEEFSARGPHDSRGRSLRELDLERRMFKYPCSYLIYSPAFDGLPDDVRDYVYTRLHAILSGADTSPDFAHLSPDDRQAILEILRDTKPDLPESLKALAAD